MNKEFLIEIPHAEDECLMIMKNMNEMDKKVFSNFKWACRIGEHTGFGFIKAENLEDAKNMIPAEIRDKARIVEVEKMTDKDLEDMHPEADADKEGDDMDI